MKDEDRSIIAILAVIAVVFLLAFEIGKLKEQMKVVRRHLQIEDGPTTGELQWRLKESEDRMQRLKDYARHRPDCKINSTYRGQPCSCELSKHFPEIGGVSK